MSEACSHWLFDLHICSRPARLRLLRLHFTRSFFRWLFSFLRCPELHSPSTPAALLCTLDPFVLGHRRLTAAVLIYSGMRPDSRIRPWSFRSVDAAVAKDSASRHRPHFFFAICILRSAFCKKKKQSSLTRQFNNLLNASFCFARN